MAFLFANIEFLSGLVSIEMTCPFKSVSERFERLSNLFSFVLGFVVGCVK